jgi:hypothetical protein
MCMDSYQLLFLVQVVNQLFRVTVGVRAGLMAGLACLQGQRGLF